MFIEAQLKKKAKIGVFSMFFTAFRWKFIVLQIRDGEVIIRIIMHLFPIHHFVVRSMLKYLIAREDSQKFTSYVGLYGTFCLITTHPIIR